MSELRYSVFTLCRCIRFVVYTAVCCSVVFRLIKLSLVEWDIIHGRFEKVFLEAKLTIVDACNFCRYSAIAIRALYTHGRC